MSATTVHVTDGMAETSGSGTRTPSIADNRSRDVVEALTTLLKIEDFAEEEESIPLPIDDSEGMEEPSSEELASTEAAYKDFKAFKAPFNIEFDDVDQSEKDSTSNIDDELELEKEGRARSFAIVPMKEISMTDTNTINDPQ